MNSTDLRGFAAVAFLVGLGVSMGSALCSLTGAPFAVWVGVVFAFAGWLVILLEEKAAIMIMEVGGLRAAVLALLRRWWYSVPVSAQEHEPVKTAGTTTGAAYTYTNSKGKTYYPHSRRGMLQHHDAPIYFFRREVQEGAIADIPDGMVIHETANGMPLLKRAAVGNG